MQLTSLLHGYALLVHQVALEGKRYLSERHEQHHFNSQPEQRARLEGDPEMGSSPFKVRLTGKLAILKTLYKKHIKP